MNEQIQNILELHVQGRSIRSIAKEFGISKSNVHRIISEAGTSARDSPVPASQQACPTKKTDKQYAIFSNYDSKNGNKNNAIMESQDMLEIEMKRLELEHEIQMKKLEIQETEINLRNRELALKSKESDVLIQKRKQEERLLVWELSEFFKSEVSLCDRKGDIEISLEEAEEKLEKIKELMQKVRKYSVKYELNPESMAFYRGLEFVETVVKGEVDEFDEDEYDYDDFVIEYSYETTSRQRMQQLTKIDIGLLYDFVK